MSGYLLALDEMCDLQHVQVRCMTACAEAVEGRWCKARVELAKAEARAAHAESHVVALEEELLEQADRHNKLMRDVNLVEHAKRKETMSVDFLVEPQNQGRRGSQFVPQNWQLWFGVLTHKITAMVSWFGLQN
jgi:acyl-ACP thioesterase